MNQEAIEGAAGEWYELGGDVQHVVVDPAVREWRFESLIRAGFTLSQAEMIAASAEVDIHWLIDLTAKGCPHETVCRIAGVHPWRASPLYSSTPSTEERRQQHIARSCQALV